MVYINEKSNYIEIPKHYSNGSTTFTLELTNSINNQTFKYENLKDLNLSGLYYKFLNMDFRGLIVGEYTYKVIGKNELLEKGILIFGDYKGSKIEYKKSNKKIQYERD